MSSARDPGAGEGAAASPGEAGAALPAGMCRSVDERGDGTAGRDPSTPWARPWWVTGGRRGGSAGESATSALPGSALVISGLQPSGGGGGSAGLRGPPLRLPPGEARDRSGHPLCAVWSRAHEFRMSTSGPHRPRQVDPRPRSPGEVEQRGCSGLSDPRSPTLLLANAAPRALAICARTPQGAGTGASPRHGRRRDGANRPRPARCTGPAVSSCSVPAVTDRSADLARAGKL